MNKNGVKLLTAVMAFAMVLVAGFVVINGSEGSDAIETQTGVKALPENLTAGEKYYVAGTEENSTVTIESVSVAVTFLVKSGTTLTISAATATYAVYAVAASVEAPAEDGTIDIDAKSIAAVSASASGASSYEVSATATTTGTNGEGSITTTSASGPTLTGYAIKVTGVLENKSTYYTAGAIPTTGFAGPTSGTVTVDFVANATGVTVPLKAGSNTAKLDGAGIANAFSVDLTSVAITFKQDGRSSAGLNAGTLTVSAGQVTFDSTNAPTIPAASIVGVASKDITSESKGGILSADITLAEGVLGANTHIYGVAVDETKIIMPTGATLVFGERSSFNGTVEALVGAAETTVKGVVLGLEISGDKAGRAVQLVNTAGGQVLTTTNTGLTADSKLYASEVVLNSVTLNAKTFTSTNTGDSGAIALGNITVNAELTMGNVIIPSGKTVTFEDETTSKIKVASLAVFGTVEGAVSDNTTKRISNASGDANPTLVVPVEKQAAIGPYLHTSQNPSFGLSM